MTEVSNQRSHSTPTALAVSKRGRSCIIAKLVLARPLGEYVLAMPYRNRQIVDHVSIPPQVLAHARKHGAGSWLVRYDLLRRCWCLPLADVERIGWLKPSDGRPEWFVPLAKFTKIAWQDWPFAEVVVRLDADAKPDPRQLPLLPEAAYAG